MCDHSYPKFIINSLTCLYRNLSTSVGVAVPVIKVYRIEEGRPTLLTSISCHLLNSLPQVEYEGVILVVKERLRSRSCNVAEVEQLLEDKYLSMKCVKGWEEEEDDYALFASPAKKKGPKKQFKG